MGIFDDAVPGGNVAKPILIALGALLAGRMLSGGSRDEAAPETPQNRIPQGNTPQQAPQSAPQDNDNGGLLGGGLGDLLERISKAGQKDAADSWVKPDQQNKPIAPTDLGTAIGGPLLNELSKRTGISQDQLLEQLSKVLPGVVDKLTPDGRVPDNEQVAGQFRNSPW